LSDDKGKLPPCVDEIPFTLKLVDSVNHEDDYSHLLDMNLSLHQTLFFTPRGSCSISFKFHSLSADFENRSFVLLAQHGTTIGVSSAMTSVRYQLRCETSLPVPSSPPPVIWFKDRGGNRNCVEVPLRLVSSSGDNVLGLSIPIVVQLIYADGEPVCDQSILQMNREGRLLTIGPKGVALLRVRIKEVSKRHKGKLFALKISPDVLKDPTAVGISSVISFTIDVRSKVSNSAITSSLSSAYRQHSMNSLPPSTIPSSRLKRSLSGESIVSAISSFHHPTGHPPLPPLVDQQRKSPKTAPNSSPSPPLPPVSSSSSELELEMPPLVLPPATQQLSMSKIELWAFNVFHQLENMRWQLIGQESSSDQAAGSPPLPIYQMSNPNQMIDAIRSQYRSIQLENDDLSSVMSRQSDSPSSQVESDADFDFDSLPGLTDATYPMNSLSLSESWYEPEPRHCHSTSLN
jgi:hypothetical protein